MSASVDEPVVGLRAQAMVRSGRYPSGEPVHAAPSSRSAIRSPHWQADHLAGLRGGNRADRTGKLRAGWLRADGGTIQLTHDAAAGTLGSPPASLGRETAGVANS
jgi:hypothetical protein